MADARPPDSPSDAPPAPAPLPSRFRLEAVIGEGGLGTVVKAYDTHLRVHVAIKTIRHNLASEDPQQYTALRDRFRKEAIAGAQVRTSPYVVTVYDQVVDSEGNAFLIMEFMPGGTLRDRLADGLVPLPEALRMTADAARGLRDLHNAELVHRDVKPDNIFLTADGRAKIGDLGVVQMSSTTFRTRLEYGSDRGHPGTLIYMAPEQETGAGMLPPEADQYSLGAVLFELVTSKKYKWLRPAERERLLGTLPTDAAALIRKMTAADVDDRYPGMEAVLDTIADIERAATVLPPPVKAPPAKPPLGMPSPVVRAPLVPPAHLAPPANDAWQQTIPPQTIPASTPVVRPLLPASQQPAAPRPVSRRAILTGIGAIVVAGGAAGGFALTQRNSGALSLPYVADFRTWPLGQITSDVRCFINSNGEYDMRSEQNANGFLAGPPGLSMYDDFVFDVDARFVAGPADGAYGVIFRMQPMRPSDKYFPLYELLLYSNGSFVLDFYNGDGSITPLQELRSSSIIKSGQATNHLRVECRGSQITVAINGTVMGTYRGSVIASGQIGLEVINPRSGATTEAAFKNLRVDRPS